MIAKMSFEKLFHKYHHKSDYIFHVENIHKWKLIWYIKELHKESKDVPSIK